MIVKCINNDNYPLSLEKNKDYKVTSEDRYFYTIQDENLEDCKYPKEIFIIKN